MTVIECFSKSPWERFQIILYLRMYQYSLLFNAINELYRNILEERLLQPIVTMLGDSALYSLSRGPCIAVSKSFATSKFYFLYNLKYKRY